MLAAGGSYLGAAFVGDAAFRPLLRSTGLFLALGVLTGVLAYQVLRGRQWAARRFFADAR